MVVSEHVLFLKDRRTAGVLAVESYLGEMPCLDLDALVIIVGGFGSVPYWSSSENDTNNAWAQIVPGGTPNPNNNKNNTNYVRPVRGFQRDLVMTACGSSACAFRLIFRIGLGPQLISILKV